MRPHVSVIVCYKYIWYLVFRIWYLSRRLNGCRWRPDHRVHQRRDTHSGPRGAVFGAQGGSARAAVQGVALRRSSRAGARDRCVPGCHVVRHRPRGLSGPVHVRRAALFLLAPRRRDGGGSPAVVPPRGPDPPPAIALLSDVGVVFRDVSGVARAGVSVTGMVCDRAGHAAVCARVRRGGQHLRGRGRERAAGAVHNIGGSECTCMHACVRVGCGLRLCIVDCVPGRWACVGLDQRCRCLSRADSSSACRPLLCCTIL